MINAPWHVWPLALCVAVLFTAPGCDSSRVVENRYSEVEQYLSYKFQTDLTNLPKSGMRVRTTAFWPNAQSHWLEIQQYTAHERITIIDKLYLQIGWNWYLFDVTKVDEERTKVSVRYGTTPGLGLRNGSQREREKEKAVLDIIEGELKRRSGSDLHGEDSGVRR